MFEFEINEMFLTLNIDFFDATSYIQPLLTHCNQFHALMH